MTTSEERRLAALAAVDQVLAGSRGADAESELVDFKVEEGTRIRGGQVVPISSQHEPAAQALAAAAGCFANTLTGGVLVVGVDDARRGAAALTGAHSDTSWLRRRIYALTSPSHAVEVEEVERGGVRLLLVNVPDALEFIRVGDRLKTRIGTDCQDLDGARARDFLERRRGFDWSSEASGWRLSAADASALASARRHYEAENNAPAPGSDRELVRRMGVIAAEGDDPELTRAGALLLCPFEPGIEQLHLMVSEADGAVSRVNRRGGAPVLPLFDEIIEILLEKAFPSESRLVGVQRQAVRAVPEAAVRESIVNGIMHRDYRIDRSAVLITATGDPAHALKVRSPGALPFGVRADRLIASQSKPRNQGLAEALRVLGLAEKEGVGIDTLYRVMLRDGHPEPEIAETEDAEVLVRLSGGQPDLVLREYFDSLVGPAATSREDLRTVMAITMLTRRPVLRPEVLAAAAQCTAGDASDALVALETAGAVTRLLDGSRSYRLSPESRRSLGERVRYVTRVDLDDHAELIDAYLDAHEDIGRETAVKLLGVRGTRASQILSELAEKGRIVRHGQGSGARYTRR